MEIAVFKSNSVFIFYKNILGKIFAFLNFNGFPFARSHPVRLQTVALEKLPPKVMSFVISI